MKTRLLHWSLLGFGLAAVTVLFVTRRMEWASQHPPEANPSAQQRREATPGAKRSGTPEAGNIRTGQHVVPAPLGPTRGSRPEGAWARLVGRDDPRQPGTRGAGLPESRPLKTSEAESGAEVWSYHPLIQRNFRTNLLHATERLTNAKSEFDRYLALDTSAKLALVFGKTDQARTYATEVLSLYPKFSEQPWSANGDAVHNGNFVLGRIAVQEGQIEEAKRYLLEAGMSTGSPVLSSFGPNMSLARDLLENGERETVLRYFDLCGKFWHDEKLAKWTEAVKAGQMPDFGVNLIY